MRLPDTPIRSTPRESQIAKASHGIAQSPRPVARQVTIERGDLCALHSHALGRRLRFSPQQTTIVQLIVTEDLTTEAMALRLGVAPAAIRTQLDRLRAKLKVHSRAAIVATAWRVWMGMEKTHQGGHEK